MSTIEVGGIRPVEGFGGTISASHFFYNAGEKEIKYIRFSYVPYNNVNDIVACCVNRHTEASGRLTGPFPPKYHGRVQWESLWNNSTITSIVLTRIYIQYMDNTEEVIEGKDVVGMYNEDGEYNEDSSYYCEVIIPERLLGGSKKKNVVTACSDLFLKFKNDEKTLLKILDNVIDTTNTGVSKSHMYSIDCMNGYIIGDYIEKEFYANEELMKKAVLLWKASIGHYRSRIMDFEDIAYNISVKITGKKYAKKIRKYDPDYVEPKRQR